MTEPATPAEIRQEIQNNQLAVITALAGAGARDLSDAVLRKLLADQLELMTMLANCLELPGDVRDELKARIKASCRVKWRGQEEMIAQALPLIRELQADVAEGRRADEARRHAQWAVTIDDILGVSHE